MNTETHLSNESDARGDANLFIEGKYQLTPSKTHGGRIYPAIEGDPPKLSKDWYEKKKAEKKVNQPFMNSINWMELPEELRKLIKVVGKKREYSRNSPCPCGSGKRFKRCCLPEY